MKIETISFGGVAVLLLAGLLACATSNDSSHAGRSSEKADSSESAQVPSWSRGDMEFFLHGSMSTEVFPEKLLRVFVRIYPDLFPSKDLSHLGLIPDPAFGWPVGFSRKPVPHLGGLSSVGLNCAACHVGEISSPGKSKPVRVLGVTSHFDAEGFFGAVIVATFRTADAGNMKRFLSAYLEETDPAGGEPAQKLFVDEWRRQEQKIVAAMAADPTEGPLISPAPLHQIDGAELRLDRQVLANGIDLSSRARSFLKLFHNMRAALHVPDAPPKEAPPASGPGRNDAFGLLSGALFGAPQPYAPVKYGLVWNVDRRRWVHWDGNTQSPIGRNLLAALGLGAPLIGQHGQLDFALVKRHTELSEHIRPPRYAFSIDQASAGRGAAHYQTQCASCHDGPEGDQRLHTLAEVGTDPGRAQAFTQAQADRFNRFLAELETPGYRPASEPGIRGTQKYWAPSLAGVWARSPYLHNGSVRTMSELLASPSTRSKTFRRGSREFDAAAIGYADAGGYALDTSTPGNSNAGHDYGTRLTGKEKRELIEYLKTL